MKVTSSVQTVCCSAVVLALFAVGCTATAVDSGDKKECLGGPCVLVMGDVDVADVGGGHDVATADVGGNNGQDTGPIDRDQDGYSAPADCNDTNRFISPAANETCGDHIDNNCDGQIDEGCTAPHTGEVGDDCTSDASCAGGACIQDWPGGYCSFVCGPGVPCPAGSDCYDIGSPDPLCLDSCSAHVECRLEYACYPTSIGGACGPACRSDDDCGGAACDTVTGLCGTANTNNGGNNTNPPPVGQATTETITTSAGEIRSYVVYVPSSVGSGAPAPLVLAFHGHGDTAANFYNYIQLGGHADQRGFILAVLQGNLDTWDAYGDASTNPDNLFAMDVVARLRGQFTIDGSRIYAIGYSQGGFFTFALGMWNASTFAAMNIQASSNPAPGSGLVAGASRRIPVFMLIGTEDSLLGPARQTRDQLQAAGHPLQYEELPGVGHCCYQYTKNTEILDFLFQYTL